MTTTTKLTKAGKRLENHEKENVGSGFVCFVPFLCGHFSCLSW